MINPDITQLGTNSSKYLPEEKEKIEQDFKEVQEKLNSGQQLTLDDTRIVVLRARMIREEAFFIVPEKAAKAPKAPKAEKPPKELKAKKLTGAAFSKLMVRFKNREELKPQEKLNFSAHLATQELVANYETFEIELGEF
jgi:hypothetical protein